jgi:hypothetical protein
MFVGDLAHRIALNTWIRYTFRQSGAGGRSSTCNFAHLSALPYSNVASGSYRSQLTFKLPAFYAMGLVPLAFQPRSRFDGKWRMRHPREPLLHPKTDFSGGLTRDRSSPSGSQNMKGSV